MYKSGQYEQAMPLLQQVHATAPDDFEVLVYLGSAYYNAGRYQDAVTLFEKAQQINDQNPDVHYNLGNAYLMVQDWEQARAAFTKVLQLDAGYDEAKRALAQVDELQQAGADQTEEGKTLAPLAPSARRAGPPALTKNVILTPYCQAVLANPSAVLHSAGRSGYQADEVNAVLLELREYINAVAPQVSKMTSDLERAQSQVDRYRQMEQAIADALVSAKKMADDIRAEARAHARAIVAEVEAQAQEVADAAEEMRRAAEEEQERILNDAEQRAAHLRQEAEAVKEQAEQDARAVLADAEAKAQEIRAAAQEDERQVRERAAADLREAREEAARVLQDAEEARRQADEEASATIRQARDEANQILQDAAEQQAEAERQISELRAQAQREAEQITARAQQEAEQTKAVAQQDGEKIISDAENRAQHILQTVQEEAERWRAIIAELRGQKQKVEEEWFALTNSFLARLQQEQQNLRMERRREGRCHVRVSVQIATDSARSISAYSEDLSAHGLRLVTDQNLPVGTPIVVTIDLPDQSEPLQCHGRVRWARALDEDGRASFRLGVALTALSSGDEQRLSTFLQSVAPPVT